MAYDPVKRAAREAQFRAEHGVSSGTYYRMRREAQSTGVSGQQFDRLAKDQGYQVAKGFTVAKRDLSADYERGNKPSASDMESMYPFDIDDIDQYDIDKEWFFYH